MGKKLDLEAYYTDDEFRQAVLCDLKGKKRKAFFDELKERAMVRAIDDVARMKYRR